VTPGTLVVLPRFAHGHPAVGIIRRAIGDVIEIETTAGERVTTLGLALQPAPSNVAVLRRRGAAEQPTFSGDAA
jgi:hypothetical protein